MLRVSSKPSGRESAVTGLGSPFLVQPSPVLAHPSPFFAHRSPFLAHRSSIDWSQTARRGEWFIPHQRQKAAPSAAFCQVDVGGDYSSQGNSFQFSSEPSTNSSLLLESWMPSPWTLDAVSIMECSENISKEVN